MIALFRRSRFLLLMAPAALVTWVAAAAAPGQDLPALHSMSPPSFTADLAVAVDSTSHAKVKAVVSIPYPELNWQRAGGEGFTAGASFVVEMVPDKGPRRLYGDSWEKRILVPDYATTTSHRNQLVETREFEVPPGKYSIRVTVRDVRALDESTVSDRLEVRDLSTVPVGFADLEMGVVDSAAAFMPYPSREFGFNSGAIAVRAVLVDRRSGGWPRQYNYHWRVVDEGGTASAQGDTTVSVARFE